MFLYGKTKKRVSLCDSTMNWCQHFLHVRKQPKSFPPNTGSIIKWTAGKTKEEEEEVEEGGGAKSTLKFSSCVQRTIGRV